MNDIIRLLKQEREELKDKLKHLINIHALLNPQSDDFHDRNAEITDKINDLKKQISRNQENLNDLLKESHLGDKKIESDSKFRERELDLAEKNSDRNFRIRLVDRAIAIGFLIVVTAIGGLHVAHLPPVTEHPQITQNESRPHGDDNGEKSHPSENTGNKNKPDATNFIFR